MVAIRAQAFKTGAGPPRSASELSAFRGLLRPLPAAPGGVCEVCLGPSEGLGARTGLRGWAQQVTIHRALVQCRGPGVGRPAGCWVGGRGGWAGPVVPVCPPRGHAWGLMPDSCLLPHPTSDPDMPSPAQRAQLGTESCPDAMWEEVETEASRGWAGPHEAPKAEQVWPWPELEGGPGPS